MSVLNQTPVNSFVANGLTTVFNFTFQLLDSSDLRVTVDDEEQIIGSDYTVSGIGNPAGGSVTFISSPASSAAVVVWRESVLERETDYQNNGDLRASTVNLDFDRIWLALQDILYRYQLSPTMTPGSPLAGNVSLPSPGAGKFLRWNLAGTDLEAVDGTGTVPGDFVQSGAWAVARSIQSKIGEIVSVKDFGAVGNGVADDTTAFNNAGASGFNVLVPPGTYKLTSTPTGKFYTNGNTFPAFPNSKPQTFGVYQPGSGIHYADYGANVHRFGDRVLMGAAVKNNATNTASQPDWLTQWQLYTGRSFGFIQSAQGAFLNDSDPTSCNTFVVGAQTKYFTVGNAIGTINVAVNNNTSASIFAYGQYVEAYRASTANGGAYGIEIDVVNHGAVAPIDPYFQLAAETIGLQLAAGADLGVNSGYSVTAAINIQSNGANWDKGIVFGKDAIAGTNGTAGTGVAIAFGYGHSIQWYGAQGVPTSSIVCYGTTTANAVSQRIGENFHNWINAAGKPVFQLSTFNGTVNYLSVRAAGTGSPTQIVAAGDDTNVDIQLVPKGSGAIWLGSYTAGTFAQTGYITVKDAGGITRRLMVG